jgi:hypothetical protein
MIDASDFQIGDVIELLPTPETYGDNFVKEKVVVLARLGAGHLRIQFDDGRVEDHEARMAVLISRPQHVSGIATLP